MTGIFSLRRFSSSHFIRALSNIPCLDVWFHSLHTQAVSITIGFHYFYFIFLPCRKCTFRNSNIAQPPLPVQSHFPVPEEFHTFLSKTSLGVHDLLPQACNFFKKEALAQVSSCEFCEISKNTFFYRTPLVAASVDPTGRFRIGSNYGNIRAIEIRIRRNCLGEFLKEFS